MTVSPQFIGQHGVKYELSAMAYTACKFRPHIATTKRAPAVTKGEVLAELCAVKRDAVEEPNEGFFVARERTSP